jgi:hypothetical protein
MTTPFPFVSGAVLTAAQMNDITNLPINNQTASYTLLASDAGKRVIMNVGSANTVTVDDDIFSAGDTIFIANIGTATTTITEGSGVDIETSGSLALAQYGGGTLIALSASTFTFFPSGGVGVVPSTVEYLVIAGGGGGGSGAVGAVNGAGGGAGGYRSSVVGESSGGGASAQSAMSVQAGVIYTVTVGAGGAAATNGTSSSISGSNIATITTVGGGRGGGTGVGSAVGGSGGGASGTSGATNGSAGTPNEGFAGGDNPGTFAAGAGGGAGAVGGAGGAGSVGGVGVASSISGSSTFRAGGGGGSGAGGNGGGGAGNTGGAGTVNTGGGGGGGTSTGSTVGGAGGKGVVIIRTLESAVTAIHTGSLTTSGGYKIYTFNDSGAIGWD